MVYMIGVTIWEWSAEMPVTALLPEPTWSTLFFAGFSGVDVLSETSPSQNVFSSAIFFGNDERQKDWQIWQLRLILANICNHYNYWYNLERQCKDDLCGEKASLWKVLRRAREREAAFEALQTGQLSSAGRCRGIMTSDHHMYVQFFAQSVWPVRTYLQPCSDIVIDCDARTCLWHLSTFPMWF